MATRTSFEFDSNVDKVISEMGDEAEKRVEKAAHHLRNEVQKTLSGSRSGEKYKTLKDEEPPDELKRFSGRSGISYRVPGTTSTYYRASASGEPPASRLGYLRSSIGWKIVKEGRLLLKGMKIIGKVGTPLTYGAKLETGEYPSGPSHVAARPWLGPTMVRERKPIKRILGGSRWL